MIEYGNNGKIGSRWMLTRLAGDGLMYFSDKDIALKNGKHTITGLSFSPDVKKDSEIFQHLKEIVGHFMYLAYEAEKNEFLQVDLRKIDGEYWNEFSNESLTGITFFRFIKEGRIRIAFPAEKKCVIDIDPALYDMIPELYEYLTEFVHTCLKYSDDDGPLRFTFRRIVPEEGSPEEIHEEVFSGDFEEDAPAAELTEDRAALIALIAAEQMIAEGASEPEDEQDDDDVVTVLGTVSEPEDKAEDDGIYEISLDDPAVCEKEHAVNQNVSETLQKLRTMMDDLDSNRSSLLSTVLSNGLSYEEGTVIENGYFIVEVPDGFRYSFSDDGHPFVMWLPNEANPDEWEASVLSIYPNTELDIDEDFSFSIAYSKEFTEEKAEALKSVILSHINKKETSWRG